MPADVYHSTISRRLLSYYLLFTLSAIAMAAIGWTAVNQALSSDSSNRRYLTQLNKFASAIDADARIRGMENIQAYVEDLRSKTLVAYVAIVSHEGRYLAHSEPTRVGQFHEEPPGTLEKWGDVYRSRFVDSDSRSKSEYQTSLNAESLPEATLRIGVLEPSLLSTMWKTARYGAAAMLAPILVAAFGVLVLGKIFNPIASIESDLSRIATASLDGGGLSLHSVPPSAPAAIGWNRLRERLDSSVLTANHQSQLADGVQKYHHDRSEQVLKSIPDGIAVTNPEGRITFANQPFQSQLELEGTNPNGKSMHDCLKQRFDDGEASELFEANAKARSVAADIGQLDNGSGAVVRVSRHPIRSSERGYQGHHVWLVRDVTQQRMAEGMRNEFVNSVTHELRTPLASITAYAETLAHVDSIDVEKQRSLCNTINTETMRLSRLIDDLLNLSRMEVGALTLVRRETDMERVFREAGDRVKPQMDEKRITFSSQLPEKVPKCNVDKDKMMVVLINLLGNAAKYTPPGGRVTLDVEIEDSQLRIDVIDTGIGIARDDLAKVFDKFFRSADSRVHEESGTGLGLSLTQEILRLHGGHLTVHSEIDKGSKFSAFLPMRRDDDLSF